MTLEIFVGSCLELGGVWTSWRESDGISRLMRYVPREGGLVVCGSIYQITDQKLRYFWLDVQAGERVDWRLGLDPHSGSERRAVSDLEFAEDLAGLDWDRLLVGEAEIRDGKLVPISARPGRATAI